MHHAREGLTYLKLAAVTMIWGGTFVAGRFLADQVDPLLAACLRFMLASLALLLFLACARIPLARPTTGQMARLVLLGLCGIFFYNLCFFYGLHYINASRASLIVALNPAVIGLASWLLFKERLGRVKWLGIGLCLLGAAVVIVSRDPNLMQGAHNAWIGDLLILGCVMAWGAYSLLSRELNQALGPVQTVTWSVLWGTLMLTLTTLATGRLTSRFRRAAAGAVVQPAVSGCAGFGAGLYWLLRGHSANRRDPLRCVHRPQPADSGDMWRIAVGRSLDHADAGRWRGDPAGPLLVQ